MAYIGLRKPIVGQLKTDGKYETPFAFGRAVSFSDTPNVSTAELYADDTLAESERAVTSTALSIGTDDIPADAKTQMFGHAKAASGEITYNIDDATGYCGLGLIGVKKINGERKYEGRFYPKVQFSEPTESIDTRGETTNFQTPSTDGTATAVDSGDYKYVEDFATEAEALAYINGKFGVSAGG